jgi:hypothetical protein
VAPLNLRNVKCGLGDHEIFFDEFTPFCEKKFYYKNSVF